MKRLSKKGFTLVELLVVMAIIGILAAVIMGGFRSSQIRSRDAKRKSDLRQIGQSLELYYSDHDRYPASSSGRIVGCASNTSTPCVWGTYPKFEDAALGRLYFRELPHDMASTQTYYYIAAGDGQSYQIFAHLQNKEDQNCINGAGGVPDCITPNDPPTFTGDECGSICNFAVTSTNVSPSDTLP